MKPASFSRQYPGYVAAAAIINASFPWLLNENITVPILSLTLIPGLLAAWKIFGTKETLIKFVLPSILVLCAIGAQQQKTTFETIVSGEYAGAEIVVKLTDSSLCGGSPTWLRNAPYHTTAQVREIRFTAQEPWTPTNGSVFIRLPREGLKFAPGYGDICKLSGNFERIDSETPPGGFDFSIYARTRGIHYIFNAKKMILTEQGRSWSRKIFDTRGTLLEDLGKGMSNENARSMAAALLFGMKQGIDYDTRNDFLRSGTIHVLSVSGLHVGLFFSVLMIFFRFFPYTARWLALLIPVGIYAYSTGMQGPAFRAFMMLAVWCVLKAFLWKTNGLNTVAIAGVILMLLNPAIPLDIGFQYSFICVIFLLYGSEFITRLRQTMTARWKFSLIGLSSVQNRWIGFICLSFAASMTAWLASVGISMLHQGLFSPYSVPAFMVMSPFAWLSFAVFAFSIVFFWIPGGPAFFGFLLQPLLLILKGISAYFGDAGYLYTEPSAWYAVILSLILLLLLLKTKNIYRFAVYAILLAALTAGMLLYPGFKRDEILIVSGKEGRPMLVLSSARASHAFVINVPDYESARIASGYLKARGIQRAEEIYSDSMRKESCGGARYLLKQIPAGAFILPARPTRSTVYALAASQTAQEAKILVSDTSSVLTRKTEKKASVFECSGGRWNGLSITIQPRESGGFDVSLKQNKNERRLFLPLSAEKRIERVPW